MMLIKPSSFIRSETHGVMINTLENGGMNHLLGLKTLQNSSLTKITLKMVFSGLNTLISLRLSKISQSQIITMDILTVFMKFLEMMDQRRLSDSHLLATKLTSMLDKNSTIKECIHQDVNTLPIQIGFMEKSKSAKMESH